MSTTTRQDCRASVKLLLADTGRKTRESANETNRDTSGVVCASTLKADLMEESADAEPAKSYFPLAPTAN